MRTSFAKLAMALLLAGALPAGNAAAAEALRSGGTGTATGMLHQVGAEYAAATGVNVEVIANLGSAGAIRALVDGQLDIAVTARPLKPEETAKGLHQVLVLRTAFVLATPKPNEKGFKANDIPKIFSAQNPVWPDGTPMRIILRPRSETDNELLRGLFPGMDAAIEVVRRRAEVLVAPTDQDNVKLAEHTPGALITTTLTQLKTEHLTLHVVPIDWVVPTLETFQWGGYPFEKKLYFIVRATGASEGQRFVGFLLPAIAAGSRCAAQNGNLAGR